MSGPPESVLAWMAAELGAGVASVERPLRNGGSPWLIRLDSGTVELVVVKASPEDGDALATEAAALQVARSNGLAVPEVLASDPAGGAAGMPALVMTVCKGSTRLSTSADPVRLRALGRVAASVHGVRVEASSELPVRDRHMPWIDLSAMRREGHGSPEIQASTPLLSRADELLAGAAVPVGPTGLVHGDLWEGNTVWHDGELSGTIDWEAAGVGTAGVDLGSLRLDAALLHGLQAADDVLAGWEDAIGSSFEHVAYWDVVAAAQTPADMALFLPTIHEEGRPDLDGSTATHRRDEFLSRALREIQ
jgi:aminoglycoside phosphotransferase (APT) family kinase protein